MIYAAYLIVALGVVWLSIKASQYIDLIDKTTKLSGAFLGGVLLSAVTSLPELFTSISATVLINKPGLCIGNILGSDIFNLTILATLGIFYLKSFSATRVARSHYYVTAYILLIYIAIALNHLGILDFGIAGLSITTIIIMVTYILGVRHLAGEDGESTECEDSVTRLTLRQIVLRFIAASFGIIALSIVMTYITDAISIRLNLGVGLAGAIFLGVATSLPEVSSTIALFRMRNYNAAIGNIIGSNLFNFLVLCIADMLTGLTVYDFADPKVVNLLIFGGAATLIMLGMFRFRKDWAKVICSLLVLGCYIAFLSVN